MYLRPLSLSGKKMIITTDDNSGKILNGHSNTSTRSSTGRNVLSPASPVDMPKGICAMSLHDLLIFHSLYTASSISGL